jgi:hypothetical protein
MLCRPKIGLSQELCGVQMWLRMDLWKEWKNCNTRVVNLLKLKPSKQKSYECGTAAEAIAE